MSSICSACHKTYANIYTLKRHKKICKKLKLDEKTNVEQLQEDLLLITQERDSLRAELANLKKEMGFQLEIQDLKLVHEKEKRATVEQRAEKFENHLLEQSTKARYTTIINNLAPFTLTPESAAEIAQMYTVEDFKRGPQATLDFIAEHHLKDKSGKSMVICTDNSRLMFRGTEVNGEPFVDPQGNKIVNLVRQPMRKAVINAYTHILDNEDESEHDPAEEKLRSHKRALEPKNLTKALATKMAK